MLSEDTIGEENVVQENIIGTGSSSSSLKNFLSLVKPDWWILLVGTLTFALIGTLQCSMYILVSQTIDVSHLEKQYMHVFILTSLCF